MQYILTKDEFDNLKAQRRYEIESSTEELQTLCTRIANEMPILFWNNSVARPWGCGLDIDHEYYCDHCPVQDICPAEKQYSQ